AAAGLWTAGQGRVVRPPLEQVLFLPQQPYLEPGTLREQVLYASRREGPSDEQLLGGLRRVKVQGGLERGGGLGAERDRPRTLSLGEQQQLACARLLLSAPRFAFLDEATSALAPEKAQHLYEALAETPITYVSVGSDPALRKYHDQVVELGHNGVWQSSAAPR